MLFPSWDSDPSETTDKVTIRIIQKIIALISSLFPAINHVIIRILAFFRTCVFLESDFNDFFSGFDPSPVPFDSRSQKLSHSYASHQSSAGFSFFIFKRSNKQLIFIFINQTIRLDYAWHRNCFRHFPRGTKIMNNACFFS